MAIEKLSEHDKTVLNAFAEDIGEAMTFLQLNLHLMCCTRHKLMAATSLAATLGDMVGMDLEAMGAMMMEIGRLKKADDIAKAAFSQAADAGKHGAN